VFEIHDLWPLSPVELGGMSKWHPFIVAMQLAENFGYSRADWVVSMLPNAEPHMRDHGLRPGKFVYIPNGINIAEWNAIPQSLPSTHDWVIGSLKHSKRFLVCYAGAHGVANALDTVIDAAEVLRNAPVTFLLVGEGTEKGRLQRLAKHREMSNVVFLPPVPKRSIPLLLSRMDVLLISLQRCAVFRFGVSPNKLMDYMMAGKPVIQAIDAGNDLVNESGCGISVLPEDPAALASAVRKMLNLSPAETMQMGRSGQAYVRSRHAYSELAAQFLTSVAAIRPLTSEPSDIVPVR
jgi:glycosyltransferase involved in cell wall biosynthesis